MKTSQLIAVLWQMPINFGFAAEDLGLREFAPTMGRGSWHFTLPAKNVAMSDARVAVRWLLKRMAIETD